MSSHIPSPWYIPPWDEIRPVDNSHSERPRTERSDRRVLLLEEPGKDQDQDQDQDQSAYDGKSNPGPDESTDLSRPTPINAVHPALAGFMVISWPLIPLIFHLTGLGAQVHSDEQRTWVKDLFASWAAFIFVGGVMFAVSSSRIGSYVSRSGFGFVSYCPSLLGFARLARY